MVWHLDVGSSYPGAGVGPKGWAVRPLKRHASWVQNVVRQFGLYPLWALEGCEGLLLVRVATLHRNVESKNLPKSVKAIIIMPRS